MASLGQAKTLGGIGSILALLSGLLFWVPYSAGIGLLIVGLVLMLVAVKNIADTTGDQPIFNNMMYSVILAIIGPVIAAVVVFAAAASFLSTFRGFTPGTTTLPSGFLAVIGIIILAGVILWHCFLISSTFSKKNYSATSAKLTIEIFMSTCLLFLFR